jgi:uncharacterized membrane protein HdeD (DUF308 family)
MDQRVRALVLDNVPWRAGVNPLVVVVQGVVLLVIGLCALFLPEATRDLIRVLIGLALLLLSAQHVAQGFLNPAHPSTPFRILRGGVGATIGALVVAQPLLRGFSPTTAQVILGVGMLAVGILGLVGVLFSRTSDGATVEAVITSALTIAFGLVLLFGDGQADRGRPLLGWVAVVGGAGLLVYGFVLLRGRPARGGITPAPRG